MGYRPDSTDKSPSGAADRLPATTYDHTVTPATVRALPLAWHDPFSPFPFTWKRPSHITSIKIRTKPDGGKTLARILIEQPMETGRRREEQTGN